MTSTLQIYRPKADRPIDPTARLVIANVLRAAQALGFPLLLVGATARIILLENVHGLNPGRATRDVDFAFAIDDWEQFGELKEYLVQNAHCEADSKIAQRLYMKLYGLDRPYKVDLIPFGGIEQEQNQIAWPPDRNFVMNVAGYQDAMSAAVQVEVAEGMIINVASLPGIAILKVFAWVDRGHEDPKDALDLASLLGDYHMAGNLDRIYEDAMEALEAVGYDVEPAGAWLLGRDVARMAMPATIAGLADILNGNKKRPLIESMARAFRGKNDPIEYATFMLEQFAAGLTWAPAMEPKPN